MRGKVARCAIHGLVLMIVDIVGITVGAIAAYKITGKPSNVSLQLPVAMLVSIALFCGWITAIRLLRLRSLQLRDVCEMLWCLPSSVIWNPIIFVPLHFSTQGYVSSWGNLFALTVYQLPVNGFALIVGEMILPLRGMLESKRI